MNIYFAPLEGITDSIYRNIHSQFFGNIAKYYMPFISPNADMRLTNRERRALSASIGQNYHCVPQVLTKDSLAFVAAADMLAEFGFPEVNLNLGCPSGTVTGKGKGSGMLRDIPALESFLTEIFNKVNGISVSVKSRIGFNSTSEWNGILNVLEKFPFSEITVHPRTRTEFYKGECHSELFDLCDMDRFSYVYNGDINSPADAIEISKRYPSLKAVMCGRGLVANPSLGEVINEGMNASVECLFAFHNALLEAYVQDRPVNATLGHMSEIMFYMSSCFVDSKKWLKKMQKARSIADYSDASSAMFETCELKTEPYFSSVSDLGSSIPVI